MVKSGKRTSLLGLLALAAALAAVVLTRVNPTGIATVTVKSYTLQLPAAVALGALAVALLAVLAAASSARTATGLPLLAVLISAGAVAVGFNPRLLSFHFKPNAAPAPATVAPPMNPAPADPPVVAEEPSAPRPKTIFDQDYPSSKNNPAPEKKSAAPMINLPTTPIAPIAPPPLARPDNTAAIRDARTRLEAARAAAIQSLESSSDYQAAKADADGADANLRSARLAREPGSPELIAASQAALNAHAKLQKMVSDAMAKNPAAQDAARDLNAAQSGK